ncbi:type II secretion system protein [Halobacteriales archaeon QH_10_67_22]|nr:MAG: type II secretion system protein [Halobacteriales archaeon QH_10_67_22]
MTADRTGAVRGIRALARLVPWDPGSDPELDRALSFLGWELDAATVQRGADGGGLLAALAVAVPATLLGFGAVGLGLALAAGAGVAVGGRATPRAVATARRTRALGGAPELVSRAVLRMRLTPNTETVAAFAAETGRGRLAESLRVHADRARGTGRSGLASFAEEWAEWFPALRRAMSLVESAGSARPEERERALDTALTVTLEGTRETMAEFAASVRGPATALYAFGVLLPLALVAMVPAASTIGLEVPLSVLLVGYDVVLPVGLLAASAWLLVRRPVAFPPVQIPRSHPAVPDGHWRSVLAAAVTGTVAWVAAGRVVAAWTPWLVGPSVAVGAGLAVRYRPMTGVRAEVRAVEAGLPDALSLVGREVSRGRAVETAMDVAAETLETATADVLAEATRTQRQLEVGVRESLVGEYGALRTVPSERALGTAELLALAAAEGKPAGPAVVAMADHLEDLQSVEREVRRQLQQVTSTLSNTATVFGPLVGGATVSLAEQMQAEGPLSGGAPPSVLGLAVGAYVLVLAAVLTALATGLERGLDRSLVGYRAGRALLAAPTVFCLGLVATRSLV